MKYIFKRSEKKSTLLFAIRTTTEAIFDLAIWQAGSLCVCAHLNTHTHIYIYTRTHAKALEIGEISFTHQCTLAINNCRRMRSNRINFPVWWLFSYTKFTLQLSDDYTELLVFIEHYLLVCYGIDARCSRTSENRSSLGWFNYPLAQICNSVFSFATLWTLLLLPLTSFQTLSMILIFHCV